MVEVRTNPNFLALVTLNRGIQRFAKFIAPHLRWRPAEREFTVLRS